MKRLRDLIAILLAALIILPLLYMVSASFFARGDFTTSPARLFPTVFTPSNYLRAFSASNLGRYLCNSLVTALLGTALRLSVAMLAAYSLTTFHYKGRELIFYILAATMLLPGDALLLENFLIVRRMGLSNTYLGLVVTGILSPAAIFLLRQYFLTVSPEYREAAYLEGCSDLRFLSTLLAPMSQSVLIALCVLLIEGKSVIENNKRKKSNAGKIEEVAKQIVKADNLNDASRVIKTIAELVSTINKNEKWKEEG